MTILAIYSNKGGVGKTATVVNLSYLAAQENYKTLVVDLDPQSSSTFYFRVKPKVKKGLTGFLKGGKKFDKSIKATDYPNLDLLPADFSFRGVDLALNQMKRSKKRLGKILKPYRKEYDLILLDCPPSINLLAENIFTAADYCLIPLIPTTLSLRTYVQLRAFFKDEGYDAGKIYTFFSMVDSANPLHRQHAALVWKKFSRVLQTPIPLLTDIERMGVYREPVGAHLPQSSAAKAYQALWQEIETEMLAK